MHPASVVMVMRFVKEAPGACCVSFIDGLEQFYTRIQCSMFLRYLAYYLNLSQGSICIRFLSLTFHIHTDLLKL